MNKPLSEVNEIKEVLLAAASLANAVGLAVEDKKFSFADLTYFIPALLTLPPAFENAGEVGKQFAALDQAGLLEIQGYVVNELNIPQERAEEFAEESFKFASSLFLLAKNFAGFIRDSNALNK